MRCYLFPIEPLDRRYTAQWLEWFPPALADQGFDVVLIHPPDVGAGEVTAGQFLDPLQTHAYKAAQVRMFVEQVDRRKEGIVVFLDAWHPGVISAAYMRDVANLPLRLVGILHAGCYDPFDLLARSGVGRWAQGFEVSVLRALDEVTVGSEWHRVLIERAYGAHGGSMHVHPLPVRTPGVEARTTRERIVVWPHRDVPEKQTATWREAVARLAPHHTRWRFVETLQETSTKDEYYELLSRAAIAVSAARQETFGIAMIEAAQLGCRVIVPQRLSYPELFPAALMDRVDTPEDMADAIARCIEDHEAGIVSFVTLARAVATSERVRNAERGIARHWASVAGLHDVA